LGRANGLPIYMKTVSIPKLKNDDPALRMVEFYEELGWDQKSNIDTSKIILTDDDWRNIVKGEIRHANTVESGLGLSIGLLWMNQGPTGGGDTPGKVKLLAGWLS
jgi:hypothetical protein